MKQKILCVILLNAIIACKKNIEITSDALDYQMQVEKEGEMFEKELSTFNRQLIKLYAQAEDNPQKVLQEIDSLLEINKNSKSKLNSHINSGLGYFKAELLYKIGQYESSLAILYKSDYKSCHDALAIAANYIKLNKSEMSRVWIDSINCYIEDFALGNYYETVGDKTNAIKVYAKIKQHKEISHYLYYDIAVQRLDELKKPKSKLLTELYYHTGDPSFDFAPVNDNHIRSKIFEFFEKMPECRGLKRHIFRSPKTNDKDYYWIKVGENINISHDYEPYYEAKYDFFVYPEDFTVEFYNPKTKTLLTLEEWRKTL